MRIVYLFLCLSLQLNAQNFNWEISITNGMRANNASALISAEDFVVVGGHPSNDSITFITRTLDAANTWNIIKDMPGTPMLNDLHFVDNVLFAVGDAGLVMKSTDSGANWTSYTTPGNTSQRRLNAVFFKSKSKGFALGGQYSNDSIRTLLSTNDGGINWNIIMDIPGEMLNDIYFVDDSLGFIVGNGGTILKTTDGGTNWNTISILGGVGTRDFNAVKFIDKNIGIIVGGNLVNDSIQTILKTTDGGTNWIIVRDSISSMLNDVDFYDNQNGYAVGRDGTILKTNNAGDTWINVSIAGVNSFWMFKHVNLVNSSNGILSAAQGGLVYSSDINNTSNFYVPPFIVLNTLTANLAGVNALELNGEVNVDNSVYNTYFEYGIDFSNLNKKTKKISFNDDNLHLVKDTIYNLNPQELYFYRIVAENGMDTIKGNIVQAYSGFSAVPNFDFELWDTIKAQKPSDWYSMGATAQVATTVDGDFALKLETTIPGNYINDVGVILYGNIDSDIFEGGIPFAARPDSIVAYYNYEIEAGDSAFMIISFKSNGIIISLDTNFISGTSNGVFERISFPINYYSPEMPDSIIIGFANTNVISETISLMSTLTIDNISFVGTNVNIPNASFENWYVDTIIVPKYWSVENNNYFGKTVLGAHQTLDAQQNNYAILIENQLSSNDTICGSISTEVNMHLNNFYQKPSFQVHQKHKTLFAYYKFEPQNNDTLNLNVNLFENGTLIGYTNFQSGESVNTYQLLALDIFYFDSNSIPDSASMGIQTYLYRPLGNSKAWIDNISFDVLIIGEDTLVNNDTTSIKNAISNLSEISFFPNPTSNSLTITTTINKETPLSINLYDLSGKLVRNLYNGNKKEGKFNETYQINNLPEGMYLLNVATDKGYHTSLLQIKN